MGSGSFSGGSGGFGGGGSGGGGVRSGSKSTTSSGRKDSSFARLKGVIDFTRLLNRDRGDRGARATIVAQLNTPARRNHLLQLIADPFVHGVFTELFAINDHLSTGAGWKAVVAAYSLPGTASLLSLRQALIAAHQHPGTDERFVEITGVALSDLFLQGVRNSLPLYTTRPLQTLDNTFDAAVLQRTCNAFLGSVFREILRRDSLGLTEAAMSRVDVISREIADACVARFIREHHQKEGTRHRDMLLTLAAQPHELTECLS